MGDGASGVERTLVIIKPDAVARGLSGRILQRFEDAGLTVVGLRMRWMDVGLVRRQYRDLEGRAGRPAVRQCEDTMTGGPAVGVVLEAPDAVALGRSLVGPSYPKVAEPGMIRGDFAYDVTVDGVTSRSGADIVHASSSPDEAAYEIGLWFDDDELFTYPTLERPFVS